MNGIEDAMEISQDIWFPFPFFLDRMEYQFIFGVDKKEQILRLHFQRNQFISLLFLIVWVDDKFPRKIKRKIITFFVLSNSDWHLHVYHSWQI